MGIGELIGVVVGAIVALIGALWPIIKYYSDKKEKKQEAALKIMADKITEPLEDIKVRLTVLEEDNRQQADGIKNNESLIKNNEMLRLRSEIMKFARDLRNGVDMDEHDFEHIYKIYDKYTALGGNSYAHDEMDFIKWFKHEHDKIVKGEQRKKYE